MGRQYNKSEKRRRRTRQVKRKRNAGRPTNKASTPTAAAPAEPPAA